MWVCLTGWNMWNKYLTDSRVSEQMTLMTRCIGINTEVRLPNFCLTHNLHNVLTQINTPFRKNCTSYQALGGILFHSCFLDKHRKISFSCSFLSFLSFIFFQPIIISFKGVPWWFVSFFFCFLATKAARLEKWFSLYKNKQDGRRVAPFWRVGGTKGPDCCDEKSLMRAVKSLVKRETRLWYQVGL